MGGRQRTSIFMDKSKQSQQPVIKKEEKKKEEKPKESKK
jgi:hypothetical protein